MNIRKLLEKLINLNPKFSPKYKELKNKWWREPEEEFIIFEFGSRVYITMAIFFWVLSSVGIIFTIISYLSKETINMYAWLLGGLILALTGFSFLGSSNSYKKNYEEEKIKYENAKKNKLIIDRRMNTTYITNGRNIVDILTKQLKKEDNVYNLLPTIEHIITLLRDSKHIINDVYISNKVYKYNINEPLEVKSFSIVDSYLVYEELNNKLDYIISKLIFCSKYIEEKRERQLLHEIDEILAFLNDNELEEINIE